MPFRSIAATPEELARIAEAFEEAWTEIAVRVDTSNPGAARDRLAAIIAELWSADRTIDLAPTAVRRFDETDVG